MRIISKYQDYYDGMLKYGQDKSIVYVRNPKTLYFQQFTELREKKLKIIEKPFDKDGEFKKYIFPVFDNFYKNLRNYDGIYLTELLVGFCGKIYFCIKLDHKDKINYYYSLEEFEKAFEKASEKAFERYSIPDKKRRLYGFFHRKVLEGFIQRFEKNKTSLESIFYEYECPIFIIKWDTFNQNYYKSEGELILNPILKDIEFYKVLDMYKAYQELLMFISGPLNMTAKKGKSKYQGQMIEPIISDKDKAALKGFDKFSFRKEKTK